MNYVITFIGWAIDWLLIIGVTAFGVKVATIIKPSSKALKWIFGGASLFVLFVIFNSVIPADVARGGRENQYMGRMYLALAKSVWGWLGSVAAILGNVDLIRRFTRFATKSRQNK
jgi:hypothetical protein